MTFTVYHQHHVTIGTIGSGEPPTLALSPKLPTDRAVVLILDTLIREWIAARIAHGRIDCPQVPVSLADLFGPRRAWRIIDGFDRQFGRQGGRAALAAMLAAGRAHRAEVTHAS